MRTLLFSLALGIGLSTSAQEEGFLLTLDAAHGGKDKGVELKNASESQLTLQFQNEIIKRLGEIPAIHISTSRDHDELVELKDRAAKIPNKTDLVVSIHLNKTKEKSPFLTIFIPNKGDFQLESRNASTVLMEFLNAANIPIQNSQPTNWFILNQVPCPSISIEYNIPEGYILNEDEISNLSNYISEAILEIARRQGKF